MQFSSSTSVCVQNGVIGGDGTPVVGPGLGAGVGALDSGEAVGAGVGADDGAGVGDLVGIGVVGGEPG